MPDQQPIFIDANNPEYYAEILHNTSRLANRNRGLPLNQQPHLDIPGIQSVDGPLTWRL
jgi:hypothetical protein